MSRGFWAIAVFILLGIIFFWPRPNKVFIAELFDFDFNELEVGLTKGDTSSVLAWKSHLFESPQILEEAKALLKSKFSVNKKLRDENPNPIFTVAFYKKGVRYPHCGAITICFQDNNLFFSITPKGGLKREDNPLEYSFYSIANLKPFFKGLIIKGFSNEVASNDIDLELFQKLLKKMD